MIIKIVLAVMVALFTNTIVVVEKCKHQMYLDIVKMAICWRPKLYKNERIASFMEAIRMPMVGELSDSVGGGGSWLL